MGGGNSYRADKAGIGFCRVSTYIYRATAKAFKTHCKIIDIEALGIAYIITTAGRGRIFRPVGTIIISFAPIQCSRATV